jgi:non-ribosomal peptide synthetase component E (peptide arylation enzyme)
MPAERSVGAKPCVPLSCLPHLLEDQAKRIPDAPAILAVGRAPLTYGRLHQHIVEMERRLRAMGIGRHDRIAVVLPVFGVYHALVRILPIASHEFPIVATAFASEETSW